MAKSTNCKIIAHTYHKGVKTTHENSSFTHMNTHPIADCWEFLPVHKIKYTHFEDHETITSGAQPDYWTS